MGVNLDHLLKKSTLKIEPSQSIFAKENIYIIETFTQFIIIIHQGEEDGIGFLQIGLIIIIIYHVKQDA